MTVLDDELEEGAERKLYSMRRTGEPLGSVAYVMVQRAVGLTRTDVLGELFRRSRWPSASFLDSGFVSGSIRRGELDKRVSLLETNGGTSQKDETAAKDIRVNS